MKNSLYILFVGLFSLAISFGGYAQGQNDQNSSSSATQGFQSKSSKMNFLSNQNYLSNKSSANTENNINIKQIGVFNQITSNTHSNQSQIDLLQNGDYNKINLELNALKISEKVIQNGNRNNFEDINLFGANIHEAEIIQNGNNQNLTWYGSNSISEKMKVKMQGNDKILVVRNFN